MSKRVTVDQIVFFDDSAQAAIATNGGRTVAYALAQRGRDTLVAAPIPRQRL